MRPSIRTSQLPLLLHDSSSPAHRPPPPLETTYLPAMDFSVTDLGGQLVPTVLLLLARTHTFTNATSDQGGGDTD